MLNNSGAGRPKGLPKSGGRKKGTPNRPTASLRDRLIGLNCDYVACLANIVNNTVPCAVCRGKGTTNFQPASPVRFSGERTCQSCWGSKMERINPEQRLRASATLMEYCEPKRKAIEISGADGGPIDHILEVRFIKAIEGRRDDG